MSTRLLYFADVENTYDDPERVGRLAGLIDELRGPETLVLGGGDNTGPGVLALETGGRAALPFFRAVDPDADTLGNHEFDYPLDRTRGILRESPQTWVCANAYGPDGDRFAPDSVVPWTVLRAGAERVGVFGLAAPDTDDVSPQAADLAFADPVDAAREAVAALREAGVDRVVGLSHVGVDDPLARELDVPAILGGHVHDRREAVVEGTLLVRPGAGGRRLVEVELDDGATTATWHDVATASPDPSVVETYRRRTDDLGLSAVVATVDEPVERVASRGESAVGNFVADAFRRAGSADVGLMHGGSIREADPLVGEVTVADLVSLVPFDNDVYRVSVSGDDLRAALRDASGAHLDLADPTKWYGQVSNARVVWDHREAELLRARVGGDPVDPDATYALATFDYALGRDGLFRSLDRSLPAERVGSVHDVLEAHARTVGIPTDTDGRIERVNVPVGVVSSE